MLAKNVEFIQNSYCSYMTIQYIVLDFKNIIKIKQFNFLKKILELLLEVWCDVI